MNPTDRTIVLLGSPGVGKGAQASLLTTSERLPHLSTGDALRQEIAKGSDIGSRVREIVERGEFADDGTILEIVRQRLERQEFSSGFVMDGFPRTVRQAKLFDGLLAARGRRVRHAVYLSAPEDVIIRRLTGRLVCADCGATYHSEFQPPESGMRCDRCCGHVQRRADDRPDIHIERLRTYRERTQPVLEYYRTRGCLHEVDSRREIGDIADELRGLLRTKRVSAS
ncbi:MAG: nucleoside monophosphate kinase [Planctomycetota bacterium]